MDTFQHEHFFCSDIVAIMFRRGVLMIEKVLTLHFLAIGLRLGESRQDSET